VRRRAVVVAVARALSVARPVIGVETAPNALPVVVAVAAVVVVAQHLQRSVSLALAAHGTADHSGLQIVSCCAVLYV
jgi:hypothetical protein